MEQAHKDLKAVYGGESDTEDEEYNSDAEYLSEVIAEDYDFYDEPSSSYSRSYKRKRP